MPLNACAPRLLCPVGKKRIERNSSTPNKALASAAGSPFVQPSTSAKVEYDGG